MTSALDVSTALEIPALPKACLSLTTRLLTLWKTGIRSIFSTHFPLPLLSVFNSNNGDTKPTQMTLLYGPQFTSLLLYSSLVGSQDPELQLVMRRGRFKCWPGQGGDKTAKSSCMAKGEDCGLERVRHTWKHPRQANWLFQYPWLKETWQHTRKP